ncbi:HD domain-containing protein [bacterium]|nr:HD domain-containing protein [bacterium]
MLHCKVDDIKNHPLVIAFIERANKCLETIGYTEHGYRHANLVSNIAYNILKHLNFEEDVCNLGAIAGYLHDIGNVINRKGHEQSGALIAMQVLPDVGLNNEEVAIVISAVGNHEESTGEPINEVAAALILADKSDVHRTRVHNPSVLAFDIHDRVNYAAEKSFLRVNNEKKTITLELNIDVNISQVMEYFEIFLSRMVMCRKAAEFLNCKFELIINKTRLL